MSYLRRLDGGGDGSGGGGGGGGGVGGGGASTVAGGAAVVTDGSAGDVGHLGRVRIIPRGQLEVVLALCPHTIAVGRPVVPRHVDPA